MKKELKSQMSRKGHSSSTGHVQSLSDLSRSRTSACGFCKKGSLEAKLKEFTTERYFEKFNFYFAKPINEILANVRQPHVILFRDLALFDDETEYLKREYKYEEVLPRIKGLAHFYQNTYKDVRPNTCLVNMNNLLVRRNQKQEKLWTLKNGGDKNAAALALRNRRVDDDDDEEEEDTPTPDEEKRKREAAKKKEAFEPILNLGDAPSQNMLLRSIMQEDEHKSFESKVYDIYNPEYSRISEKCQDDANRGPLNELSKNFNERLKTEGYYIPPEDKHERLLDLQERVRLAGQYASGRLGPSLMKKKESTPGKDMMSTQTNFRSVGSDAAAKFGSTGYGGFEDKSSRSIFAQQSSVASYSQLHAKHKPSKSQPKRPGQNTEAIIQEILKRTTQVTHEDQDDLDDYMTHREAYSTLKARESMGTALVKTASRGSLGLSKSKVKETSMSRNSKPADSNNHASTGLTRPPTARKQLGMTRPASIKPSQATLDGFNPVEVLVAGILPKKPVAVAIPRSASRPSGVQRLQPPVSQRGNAPRPDTERSISNGGAWTNRSTKNGIRPDQTVRTHDVNSGTGQGQSAERTLSSVKRVIQSAAAKKSRKFESTAEEMTTTIRNESTQKMPSKGNATRRLDQANDGFRCTSSINVQRNAQTNRDVKDNSYQRMKPIPSHYVGARK